MFERVATGSLWKGLSDRRKFVAIAAMALLAACQTGPRVGPSTTPVPDRPTSSLPTDTDRHRVALIVPLTGPNASVGQSIANGATMALLDTNASNLRITTYDSSTGIEAAASKAIADGNKLILGPLLGDNTPIVARSARPAGVPMISFSNDTTVATRDVYIMGNVPEQAIRRTVTFASSRGVKRFGALIPAGQYGQKASAELIAAVRDNGGTVVAMESYDRSAGAVAAAARRLNAKGPFEAVLIADGGRLASQAAPLVKTGSSTTRILGTELWSGESVVISTPALRGAWFSTVSDGRFGQFSTSYRDRFESPPNRLATLGYDAVLLTLRIAREWRPGTSFPTGRLSDRGGFLGLDGPFRFNNGVIERAFEVREVRANGASVIGAAPDKFED